MGKKKSFINRTHKRLLTILGLLAALFLVLNNCSDFFDRDHERKNTEFTLMKQKIELRKELPEFQISYLVFYTRYMFSRIGQTLGEDVEYPEDYLLNMSMLENVIYKEYSNEFDTTYTHSDIDATHIYTLAIKQTGNITAKNVMLKVKRITLKQPFYNYSSKTLNNLRNNHKHNNIQRADFEIIKIGDIPKDKSILIPTLIGFNKVTNDIEGLVEDYKTGKNIFVPIMLYYKNEVKNTLDSIDIRPMLDYNLKQGLFISAKG